MKRNTICLMLALTAVSAACSRTDEVSFGTLEDARGTATNCKKDEHDN